CRADQLRVVPAVYCERHTTKKNYGTLTAFSWCFHGVSRHFHGNFIVISWKSVTKQPTQIFNCSCVGRLHRSNRQSKDISNLCVAHVGGPSQEYHFASAWCQLGKRCS